MATADFKCKACGLVMLLDTDPAKRVGQDTGTHYGVDGQVCFDAAFERVWQPVAIGRVAGAGGSPARG